MKLFDIFKALTTQKRDITEHPNFRKFYNPFMITRYLSMNPEFASLAEYINVKMPPESHYLFLLNVLPTKFIKLKYYKKDKELMKEEKDAIKLYFRCNEDRCNEIIELLPPESIKNIIDAFGGKVKRKRKTKTKK